MDDQQLDNLLRNVASPHDWEQRLKLILAQQAELDAESNSASKSMSNSVSKPVSNSMADPSQLLAADTQCKLEAKGVAFEPHQTRPALAGISSQSDHRHHSGYSHWRTTAWVMGLATSIVILFFSGSIWWLSERNRDERLAVDHLPPHLEMTDSQPPDAESNQSDLPNSELLDLAQLDQQSKILKNMIAMLETEHLRQQLHQLESDRASRREGRSEGHGGWEQRNTPSRSMLPADLTAVSLVATAESILIAGFPSEYVKQDLQFVVQRYPQSNEAIRAAEILSSLN